MNLLDSDKDRIVIINSILDEYIEENLIEEKEL